MTAVVAVGALPAGLVAGGLVHRLGPRPLIVAGLVASAAGSLVMIRASLPSTVVGLLLASVGMGLAMTAASASIMGNAPAHRAGMAASVEEVSYELGSLSGVAILGSVLASLYTATVRLPNNAPPAAEDSLDGALVATGGQQGPLLDAAHAAFDNGYAVALVISAAVMVAGAVLAARKLAKAPANDDRLQRTH